MHTYETDGRSNVVLAMLAASVPLTWALNLALNKLIQDPEWWVSAPSMFAVFSTLFWTFDHHLWKLGLLSRLKLVSVPDISGEWVGEIESSFDQDGQVHKVSVMIKQRWSKMVVYLETEHSRSRSVVASFRISEAARPELTYQYLSEPKSNAPSTMEMHRGTTSLLVTENGLEGDYYSGRGRREHGTISLRRSRTRAQIANYN